MCRYPVEHLIPFGTALHDCEGVSTKVTYIWYYHKDQLLSWFGTESNDRKGHVLSFSVDFNHMEHLSFQLQ